MLRIFWKICFFLGLCLPLAAQAEDFPLRLAGPWDLYRCHFLTPDAPLPPDPVSMMSGKSWEALPCGQGKGEGYGTYRLRLPPLPARAEGYEIGLKVAFSAYRLFLFPEHRPDQAQVVDSGRVGTDEATMLPAYQQRTVAFRSQRNRGTLDRSHSDFQLPAHPRRPHPASAAGSGSQRPR